MRVFVTVGTTQFGQLVETVLEDHVLDVLSSKGYKKLILQTGKLDWKKKGLKKDKRHPEIEIQIYDYKKCILPDIESADLVISHAGAGTCLEVLSAKKPLVVVINEELMGNHQIELAEKLAKLNHCDYCTTNQLRGTLKNFNPEKFIPFEKGDIEAFSSHINNLMGV